jgi:hypothetical protein
MSARAISPRWTPQSLPMAMAVMVAPHADLMVMMRTGVGRGGDGRDGDGGERRGENSLHCETPYFSPDSGFVNNVATV